MGLSASVSAFPACCARGPRRTRWAIFAVLVVTNPAAEAFLSNEGRFLSPSSESETKDTQAAYAAAEPSGSRTLRALSPPLDRPLMGALCRLPRHSFNTQFD